MEKPNNSCSRCGEVVLVKLSMENHLCCDIKVELSSNSNDNQDGGCDNLNSSDENLEERGDDNSKDEIWETKSFDENRLVMKLEKNTSITYVESEEFDQKYIGISAGKTEFWCCICRYYFINEEHLKQHISLYGRNHYMCKFCGQHFREKLQLKSHIREEHGIFLFSCNLCGKKLSCKRNLETHTPMCEQEFKCTVCEKVCKTKTALINHLKAHKFKHACKFCQEKFPTRLELRNHRYCIAKSFTCEVCNRRFFNHGNLIMHSRKCSKSSNATSSHAQELVLHQEPKCHSATSLIVSESPASSQIDQILSISKNGKLHQEPNLKFERKLNSIDAKDIKVENNGEDTNLHEIPHQLPSFMRPWEQRNVPEQQLRRPNLNVPQRHYHHMELHQCHGENNLPPQLPLEQRNVPVLTGIPNLDVPQPYFSLEHHQSNVFQNVQNSFFPMCSSDVHQFPPQHYHIAESSFTPEVEKLQNFEDPDIPENEPEYIFVS